MDAELQGYVFIGIFVLLILSLSKGLRLLERRVDSRKALKRGDLIQCDLCPQLMRPDGLHTTEDDRLFFPNPPQMFRHPLHIVRTQVLKQPIYGSQAVQAYKAQKDDRLT